jgi:hypothetical protein
LQALIDAIDSGSTPTDMEDPSVPVVAKLHAEVTKLTAKIAELKTKHSNLVESALVAEGQTTDPEQLKLVKETYEELTTTIVRCEKLKADHACEVVNYRKETSQLADEMGKRDIGNADSTEYILRVMSAVLQREVTDIDEAEREAEIAIGELRRLRSDVAKTTRAKVGRGRSKKSAATNATEAVADADADADADVEPRQELEPPRPEPEPTSDVTMLVADAVADAVADV